MTLRREVEPRRGPLLGRHVVLGVLACLAVLVASQRWCAGPARSPLDQSIVPRKCWHYDVSREVRSQQPPRGRWR